MPFRLSEADDGDMPAFGGMYIDKRKKGLKEERMTEAEAVVRAFCGAMKTRDPESIRPYLAENAHFYIQGVPAAVGIDKVVENIGWQMSMFPKGYWYEILNLATDGTHVFTQRIDWTVHAKNGYLVGNPILGVFDVVDGKITRWIDYWDDFGQVISSCVQ